MGHQSQNSAENAQRIKKVFTEPSREKTILFLLTSNEERKIDMAVKW